uniref:recombinase family protein n=1 Tax=Rhodococcus qingshengii TaxID=334542 RepID=UPI001C4E0FF9|nr:recombinase family protein [Rhodococcus qingshengii]
MRVAAYLRQSMDRTGNEYAIERQRKDVETLVAQRGWTLVETFVDNDVSATARKPRPAFERMMNLVDEGGVDVIVARHVDRLLRRLVELESVMERCQAHGVVIVTASDGVDTSTDGGRLVARILASVGQGEVERKSDRQKSATAQAAAQGRWIGGRRAFGYEAKGMIIRLDEAAAIRDGYAMILAGEPVTAVMREWNDRGLLSTQNDRNGEPKQWTRGGTRDVLLNPRNAGLRRHRPENSHEAFRQNPEAFIVGKAQWPGIVDEDTWRAAVRVLVSPDRRRPAINAQALLTGVGRCGRCAAEGIDSTMHTGGARRHYRTYRCKTNPSHLARQAEPIEEYVEAVMVERLSRPDALAVFAPTVEAATRDLGAEAHNLRTILDGLAIDYADGKITRQQLHTATDRARSKLSELETEMATAGAADLVAPLVTNGDVATAWADLTTPRKRTVIDALAVVTMLPLGRGRHRFTPESFAATIEIEWRNG